ncbi:hypothetical protein PoMZ_12913 [Pyricularia oryzae]|uniref:Uncharacterized protein n=1 Tax=Pyricularia oryzae TaxID=318829 RepID=A0A4P7NVI7_PYROR|nr:hypothetical protein PoMZ_12913 [Pyricularia oryzae]
MHRTDTRAGIYGGTSVPFQSQILPLCSGFSPNITSSILSAAFSGSCRSPLASAPDQNSFEKSVLTVPGWYATAKAASPRPARFRSCQSKVRVRLLTAALEARYVYQPPCLLSWTDPTRADMLTHTEWFGSTPLSSPPSLPMSERPRGRKRAKCFISIKGPRVLIRNESSHAGQGKSQPEVVAPLPGEVLGCARLGGGAHAVLVRHVDAGHVQSGRERTLIAGEVGQQRGFGPVWVRAARRQDGQGGAAEEGAREVVAYAAGGRADQSPGFGHFY